MPLTDLERQQAVHIRELETRIAELELQLANNQSRSAMFDVIVAEFLYQNWEKIECLIEQHRKPRVRPITLL